MKIKNEVKSPSKPKINSKMINIMCITFGLIIGILQYFNNYDFIELIGLTLIAFSIMLTIEYFYKIFELKKSKIEEENEDK